MIRPIGPLQNGWVFRHVAMTARGGPQAGTLAEQLGALKRRRLLGAQQRHLQAGGPDVQALAPYRLRPRPPS